MRLTYDGPAGIPHVVAIGAWDPLVAEHRELFRDLAARAAHIGARAVAPVLDPHPASYMDPSGLWPVFDDLVERASAQRECGLEDTAVIRLTRFDLEMDSRELMGRLVRELALSELWLGHNQSFGMGPSGTTTAVTQAARELGVAVRVLPPANVRRDCRGVRELLRAGRLKEAVAAVGRAPRRARPDSGELQFGWPAGRYRVRSSAQLERGAPDLFVELVAKTPRVTVARWPRNAPDSLSFVAGPADA